MSEFRNIAQVLTEIDRWDAKLPAPKYGAAGEESFSSKLRRAAAAFAITRANERTDPGASTARQGRMAAAEASEREKSRHMADQAFWDGMPAALRAMGLLEQEMRKIAELDLTWPAVVEVKKWMDGQKPFLTMGGPCGTGKTLAAASCLLYQHELIVCESYHGKQWRPRWGCFTKANAIARLSYFDKNDRLFLDRLAAVRFLVIDDLGTEAKYDTWQSTFTELIDGRAREEKRTIITTNLTSAALKTAYGARAWRRLEEFGAFAAAKRPEAGAA